MRTETVSPLRVAGALRDAWAARAPGWLRADLFAGAVVGVVALPLSMALAIASGAPPEAGLATAIVAGGLIALLGGSTHQVSGPTAAFVVILAPIAARYGLGGLAVATLLAGAMLVVLALLRLGRLIQFVPYPVTIGFTAGIAIVIATLQIPGFFDLELDVGADAHFAERTVALARALPAVHWPDAAIGAATLAILVAWRRTRSRVPAPLVALLVGGGAAYALARLVPGFEVATLASRFGTPEQPAGIPRELPSFGLPWTSLDGGLSLDLVVALLPAAATIAMLAAIESLLSAVVADGVTGTQHDPDGELLGLGIGNLVAPFFGGIPATGALARTATNIRSGARTPLAAVFHALFVLGAMLLLAPVLGHLPMAALAALLLMVAWNMSEARHVVRVLREAPRGDAFVLVTCLVLTVAFDMTVAVAVGLVLAAVLFMRRMVEITSVRLVTPGDRAEHEHLPPGVGVYEIAGPLFFGAAHKATATLRRMAPDLRVLVIDLERVPTIDATGLFNLRSAVDRLRGRAVRVLLAGASGGTRAALERAGLESFATVREALDAAGRDAEPSANALDAAHG